MKKKVFIVCNRFGHMVEKLILRLQYRHMIKVIEDIEKSSVPWTEPLQ